MAGSRGSSLPAPGTLTADATAPLWLLTADQLWRRVRREEKEANDMTSSLTDLRPPPTRPPITSLHASKRPSTAGYWVAAVVAVLGLTRTAYKRGLGRLCRADQLEGASST